MQVRVTFRPRRQEDRAVRLPAGATVADLLRSVGASADGAVAVRGGVPVPEDAELAEGDEILLLSAFSGG